MPTAALRAALGRRQPGSRRKEQAVPRLPLVRETCAQALAAQTRPGRPRGLAPAPAAAAASSRAARPTKLEPGQPYAGLAPLAQRLAALGDLTAATAAAGGSPTAAAVPVYDAALVDAVKRLPVPSRADADGIIGKATFEQLNVPPAARVQQIELAMERLRWTPRPARAVIV